MTMMTSTLFHMSWSITTEEQRLVQIIFHKKKKNPDMCCWLWSYIHISVYLYCFQPAKQILFVIQALVEITGLFDDAVVPWDAKKCDDFLNIIHSQIDGLRSCVSTVCLYLHIRNVISSRARGTHSLLSECRAITKWRGTKSCIFILKDWDKWQSWTRWDSTSNIERWTLSYKCGNSS